MKRTLMLRSLLALYVLFWMGTACAHAQSPPSLQNVCVAHAISGDCIAEGSARIIGDTSGVQGYTSVHNVSYGFGSSYANWVLAVDITPSISNPQGQTASGQRARASGDGTVLLSAESEIDAPVTTVGVYTLEADTDVTSINYQNTSDVGVMLVEQQIGGAPVLNSLSPNYDTQGNSGLTAAAGDSLLDDSGSAATPSSNYLLNTPGPTSTMQAISLSYNLASAPVGAIPLTLSNSYGASSPVNFYVCPVAAQIGTVSVSSLIAGQANTFTISGVGFGTNPSVLVYGTDVVSQLQGSSNDSSIQMTVTLAADATGSAAVSVTPGWASGVDVSGCPNINSGLSTSVAVQAEPVNVTSIDPEQANAGSTLTVRLKGTGFGSGSKVATVKTDACCIATSETTSINIVGDPASMLSIKKVQIGEDQPAGIVNFIVTNASGGSDSAPFTVRPVIQQLNPPSAAQGTPSLLLAILGAGFGPSPTVNISGSGVNLDPNYVSISNTEIDVYVSVDPDAALGSYQVTVTSNAITSDPQTFNVTRADPQPVITVMTPTSGAQGKSIALDIKGTGFGDAPVVNIANNSGSSIDVASYGTQSDTEVVANFTIDPAAPVGPYNVTVTSTGHGGQSFQGDPAQATSAPQTFTVTPAQVSCKVGISSGDPSWGFSAISATGQAIGGSGTVSIYFTGPQFGSTSQTVAYGPYSTPSSIASHLAALITKNYSQTIGLYAQSFGPYIIYKGNSTLGSGPLYFSGNSFTNDPAQTTFTAAAACPPPEAAHIVGFKQLGPGKDLGNGLLHFEYGWKSSTGKIADVKECKVQEVVTYELPLVTEGPPDKPYTASFLPSPPWAAHSGIVNPATVTVSGDGAGLSGPDLAGMEDDQKVLPFAPTYASKTLTAGQVYQYKCPNYNGGNWNDLITGISIVRTVAPNGSGGWKYTITKSRASASINPLP